LILVTPPCSFILGEMQNGIVGAEKLLADRINRDSAGALRVDA